MARPGITFEQVAAVADAMLGKGQQPTINGVRERIGTGSPNTIHKHLLVWRAARPQTIAAVPELPASLGGESLFLRKIFPGILLGKISKNVRDCLCLRRPRFVLLRSFQPNKGLKHYYAMT